MSMESNPLALPPYRNTRRPFAPLAFALAAVLLGPTAFAGGQTAGVNQGGPESVHAQAGMNPLPQPGVSAAATQVEQMRQAERRRRLATESARLLQLSTELKAQIDSANPQQLSLDTLRKAAEIEKLAHDLKSWLKD